MAVGKIVKAGMAKIGANKAVAVSVRKPVTRAAKKALPRRRAY